MPDAIILLFIFFLGISTGSFINVLESRLFKGEDILKKPSHCDYCKKKLKPVDLIPVVSWLIYRGKTRCCKRRLSIQYPLVEFVTGVSFVVIFALGFTQIYSGLTQIEKNNLTIQQFSNVFFYFTIFTLAFTVFLQDLKYQEIHGGLLKALIGVTLVFNFCIFFSGGNFQFPASRQGGQISNFQNYFLYQIQNASYKIHLIPAFLSALPFYLLYKLSKERWLGEGDVWITCWMGFFLGFPKVFWAIYFGLIIGGLVSFLVLLLKLKKLRDTISLGPFLLTGALISLFLW